MNMNKLLITLTIGLAFFFFNALEVRANPEREGMFDEPDGTYRVAINTEKIIVIPTSRGTFIDCESVRFIGLPDYVTYTCEANERRIIFTSTRVGQLHIRGRVGIPHLDWADYLFDDFFYLIQFYDPDIEEVPRTTTARPRVGDNFCSEEGVQRTMRFLGFLIFFSKSTAIS